MDLNSIKESIVENVYHITSETKVPLHKHAEQDEIFYCMKGFGFGVLEDGEEEFCWKGIYCSCWSNAFAQK